MRCARGNAAFTHRRQSENSSQRVCPDARTNPRIAYPARPPCRPQILGRNRRPAAEQAKARQALENKFLAEAGGDPQRAESIRKAYYTELAFKSLRARQRRNGGEASRRPAKDGSPGTTREPPPPAAHQPPSRPAGIRMLNQRADGAARIRGGGLMGFNKFAWVDAVAADGRLTEGERFVLTMTAISYVTYGEDVFHVRQATIAERFATSERTVRRAQTRARELGYLILVRPRQRGRGHHGPDHHRLVIPDNLSSITGEIPDTDDRNTRQEWPKYLTETTEIPDTADSSTSGNDTPKGSLIGSLIGSLEGRGSPEPGTSLAEPSPTPKPPPQKINFTEEPEPPRFCQRHPLVGTTENCRGCADARLNHDAWKKDTIGRLTELKATIRAGIDACNGCDLYGRLDDQSDCPRHPNFRQPDVAELMATLTAIKGDVAA